MATNTFPIFEVPIIPLDLRQEETLIQIADCLDYLSKVTNIVFDCINARISQNKKRISDLQDRASAAKMKVEKLKGVKKATQIFSTSKYPASDIHKDYMSIFNEDHKCVFTPSNVRITEKYNPPKDGPSVEEKLHFFHVKTTSNRHLKSFSVELNEGLGKLPAGVESVSSLLLFNTSENPYERYVTLDPMGVANKVRRNVCEDAPSQMEAAPISITKQEQLDQVVKESYFYSPSLGDVPNIDAPLDLPDLPGIADDLKYSLDLGPGFAPSVTTTPAVPDLPTIPEDSFKDLVPSENGESGNGIPVQTHPPPPPPPPPPSTSPPLVQPPPPPPPPPTESSIQPPPPPPPPPTEPPMQPPPPPPPLPAPESEGTQLITKKSSHPTPAIIHATSDDARANLMAAIRNAGGKAKLRQTQSGRDESKRIKEEKNLAAGGGDLMADLHNKLLLRRKGISGKVKKDVPLAVSAMDKVSAMIPPPVQQDVSSATEDDDWDE